MSAFAADLISAVSAGAVVASAGYVSAKVREIAASIEQARELAEANRELIAGDPDAGPSIYDRLDRLEPATHDEHGGK